MTAGSTATPRLATLAEMLSASCALNLFCFAVLDATMALASEVRAQQPSHRSKEQMPQFQDAPSNLLPHRSQAQCASSYRGIRRVKGCCGCAEETPDGPAGASADVPAGGPVSGPANGPALGPGDRPADSPGGGAVDGTVAAAEKGSSYELNRLARRHVPQMWRQLPQGTEDQRIDLLACVAAAGQEPVLVLGHHDIPHDGQQLVL
eukprot:CAMPEP_0171132972 /NCGR_PEP_ID=MMETSP0766_2-20121228/125469_1 /TAXON_ID=439317 /ORGANISM="Gambierdiscus australes, Strain CAWD 149" /LENGTH=205 /DNA_ID=CAMNT_0011596329 /DNA_START=318 /DNA_END=931 /DNA_ORIENTATION=+